MAAAEPGELGQEEMELGQEEMATMLGEGVERTLVPLVRRFDAQLGLVSDSQDALLKRLDTVTDGSCSRGMPAYRAL